MFDRKIKNLRLMPTSELIFNTVYNLIQQILIMYYSKDYQKNIN